MKAWKVLGAILALVGAVVGSGAMWVGSVAVRRRAEMERRVAGLLAEARSRDPVRPVLYGQATPGNAWDDYDRALVLVHGAKHSIREFERYLVRDAVADRGKVEKTLSAFAKALDGLQAGAHRAQGAFPSHWESGSGVRRPVLSESRFLVMFAAARARLLAESGKARDALRLLLDAVQFSHDSAQNGFDFGYTSEGYLISLEELHYLVATQALDRDDLTDLDHGLERADNSFPSTAICAKNVLLVRGMDLLKEPGRRAFDPELPAAKTWRFGFSDQIVQADAFDFWSRMVDLADIDDRGSWAEAQQAHSALETEIHAQKNPLARFVPRNPRNAISARECRARIRLVRAAARARAGGAILDLDDPFGGRLLRSENNGRLRIWSVGLNGTDDGGDDGGEPGWLWWSGRRLVPAKDIVIEFSR